MVNRRAALRGAADEDKPILLSVDAGWCAKSGSGRAPTELLEDHRRLNPVTTTQAGTLRGRGRDRVQAVSLRGLIVDLDLEL
ncbi:MAG: hypothetical protein H7201_00730 [Candidatus Saccharibacteria bacterium]|nr:hypothetical protein [Microbacteriaceae bacterium]